MRSGANPHRPRKPYPRAKPDRIPKYVLDLIEDGFENPLEAARFLNISRSQVYNLVRDGLLSHTRMGKVIAIPKAALREYAARNTRVGKVA